MEPTDLTIEILRGIRDEIRETRTEIHATRTELSERLDGTNRRLDETNRRIVGSEVRTATAITALAGDVREMTDVLRAQSDLRPRVEQCEREIAELKRR